MKTARDRAREVQRLADSFEGNSLTPDELVDRITQSFAEHARDQRRLCAERAQWEVSAFSDAIASRAHSAAMGAPGPGESGP